MGSSTLRVSHSSCSGPPSTSYTKPFSYTDPGDADVLGKASSICTEIIPASSKREKDHQDLVKWVRVRRSLAEFWKGAWFDSESVPWGEKPRQKLSMWNRTRNRKNDFQCQVEKPHRHLNQNFLAIKNRKCEKLKFSLILSPPKRMSALIAASWEFLKQRLSFALRERQKVWHNPHPKEKN